MWKHGILIRVMTQEEFFQKTVNEIDLPDEPCEDKEEDSHKQMGVRETCLLA